MWEPLVPGELLLSRSPTRGSASRSSEASISRKRDRKSTRLNSSHLVISYAVFCLKKKKKNADQHDTHAREIVAPLLQHVRTHVPKCLTRSTDIPPMTQCGPCPYVVRASQQLPPGV